MRRSEIKPKDVLEIHKDRTETKVNTERQTTVMVVLLRIEGPGGVFLAREVFRMP